MLFPSLQAKLARYEELEQMLADPEVLADTVRMVASQREYGGLAKVALPVRAVNELEGNIETARELIAEEDDAESKEYAEEELAELLRERETQLTALEDLVATGDAISRGSLIMEIRAGTGGDEASLFAANLFRMYSHYAEQRKWTMEVLSSSPTGLGGFKEIVSSINGKNAYSRLKFAGGVHRVQRVPETETSGRIHTSAVTVAILPEADEVDVAIDEKELRIDVFRSSGPGGQSVNTTDSAVRVTHIPSGLVVSCQDEKSQHKNKSKALKILRSRLLERAQEEQHAEISASRKSMVGSGDRSERIRTYNFPQSRMTDHRINMTLHSLERIMDGEIDGIVDALITSHQAELLRSTTES